MSFKGCFMSGVNDTDRKDIKDIYKLTNAEVFDAEKMHHRSNRSLFACAKLIKERRLKK